MNVNVGAIDAWFEYDPEDINPAEDIGKIVAMISGENWKVEIGQVDHPVLGQIMAFQGSVVAVRIGGVFTAKYDPEYPPTVSSFVMCNGDGRLRSSSGGRGLVMAVYTNTQTADVFI